jgi:hypothetical protein
MSTSYRTRIMSLLVVPEGEPSFSEMATKVFIEDEAGGEFVIVEQCGRTDLGKIAINPEEWPVLRAAIDQMVAACEAVK